ncbi:YhjR family protein [Enterobacter cloacae subsp. cloacae]|nr:YhjR family protein [Enterobacter cloacae subsp. cloacae]
MDNNEPGTQSIRPWVTFQNDFLALTQAFSLPEIDYTDISQREQLAAAIKRWPLLAEFTQQQ